MSKVSVIIPTYNSAEYITEAIESVLRQKHKDIEIIVVDDGSIDNTKEILKPYIESKSIKYIFQANKGPGAARNTGIRVAEGEFIAFLDSDDLYLDNALSKKVDLLMRYPKISLVFSDYYFLQDDCNISTKVPFYSSKKMLDYLSPAIVEKTGDYYLFGREFYKHAILNHIAIHTSTILVRSKCFNEVGLFDVILRVAEDDDMWFRLEKKYLVSFINEPLSIYRKKSSGLSSNVEKYCIDGIVYFRKLLSDKEIQNDHELQKHIKNSISYRYFELGQYYFERKQIRLSRKQFINSVHYKLLRTKAWLYVLLGFLPDSVTSVMKGIYERMKIR
jgi:glycosyltransferase involved in cell wall biosynthesis